MDFNTCQQCGTQFLGETCHRCRSGKASIGSKTDRDKKGFEVDSSLIFKRYLIKELKVVNQIPGFAVYSLKKSDRSSDWTLVQEHGEFEGENTFLKYLFGREAPGYVYYVREGLIPVHYEWDIVTKSNEYRVGVDLALNLDMPKYFLDLFKGYDSFGTDHFQGQLGASLKHQLVSKLVSSDIEYVDFTQFQSSLESFAKTFLEKLRLDVIGLSIRAELKVDETYKTLEAAKARISVAEEEYRHKIAQEHTSTRFIDEHQRDTRIQQLDSELVIKLKDLQVEKKVAEAEHQNRLDNARQQYEQESQASGYKHQLTLQDLKDELILVEVKEEIETTSKKGAVEREAIEDMADVQLAKNLADTFQQPNAELKPQRFKIKDGDTGHSYETIISPYLVNATSVVVEEPWTRLNHQVSNLISFCETVMKQKSIKKITLFTTYEESKSQGRPELTNELSALKKSMENFGVELDVQFNQDLHDRSIRVDNGWQILIGRGLDFFQRLDNWHSVGAGDYVYRKCRETDVDIYRV